jgi:hypothetical protein
MKTRLIAVLAASVVMFAGSQVGFAQDEGDDQPVDASSEEAPAEEPSESADADDDGDDAAEEDAEPDGAAESDDAPADSDEAEADADAPDADADAESADAESADADEEQGPRVGPGGKPLREDYPGTEESKQARMDTDRIEGLTFDEEDSEEVYDLRIRELETKVDDLKEKVFRSKSRIVLLKETVLTGSMAGSRAILSHNNDLGGAYVLRRAHYSLDGSRVFDERDDDGSLADRGEIELFNGAIAPGTHTVSLRIELQGSGYGVFSYMDDYKFTIRDSCEFSAQEGHSTAISVRLYDRGGRLAAYEERPGIECVVNSLDLEIEDVHGASVDEEDADNEDANEDAAAKGAEASE